MNFFAFGAPKGHCRFSIGDLGEERQNAKGMFRPEHCVCFSVLVQNITGPEKGERNAYLLG
jgi:hypothetical protein